MTTRLPEFYTVPPWPTNPDGTLRHMWACEKDDTHPCNCGLDDAQRAQRELP